MHSGQTQPTFLFVTCQVGAEQAVKGELARRWPTFRFAYSRPGFLTFRLTESLQLPLDFDLKSVFARAYGFSLGKTTAHTMEELAQGVWRVYEQRPARRIHVWSRDTAAPGDWGFEPGITPEAVRAKAALHDCCPSPEMLAPDDADPEVPGRRREHVLDCILVATDEWWVGTHRVRSVPSRWPGGMIPLAMPGDAVSRAWLKMEEGLRWSGLPIPAGARCAEIGSAPGGASQALLARGIHVLGIDPAEMAPEVLTHPQFTHLRRRAAQVRRREFRKIRWLTADMNVAPNYTLDVVEDIVTRPDVQVRGMLLTLKLLEWDFAERVPEYLRRIRGWGYPVVRARQLQHNRQEICVVALRRRGKQR